MPRGIGRLKRGNVVTVEPIGDDGKPADETNGTGSALDPAAAFAGGTDAGGDSGTGDGTGSGEPVVRKRGRPKGSSNSPKKKASVDLAGIEALLMSVHTMMAAAMKAPEMALDPKEAEALASAISTVQEHYPVSWAPKTMAWLNLGMVAGGIYGPRIFVLAAKRKPKATPAAPVIMPMPKSPEKAAAVPAGTTPSQLFPMGYDPSNLASQDAAAA